MAWMSDLLLGAGTLTLILWCAVLARRLSKFNDLDKGMGAAVAVLSAQVDDMTKSLQAAQATAQGSGASIAALTERAEQATRRLELMLAALHDLPAEKPVEKDVMSFAHRARNMDEELPGERPLPLFLSGRQSIGGRA